MVATYAYMNPAVAVFLGWLILSEPITSTTSSVPRSRGRGPPRGGWRGDEHLRPDPRSGGTGWDWHLVEAELRSRGHVTVAPDLPGDDSATLTDYAQAVVEAVGDRRDVIVVGHSFGAFTAPLVAARLPASGLVLVAGMVPSPGERPDDWWTNTGYAEAVVSRPPGTAAHVQRHPGQLLPRHPRGARPRRIDRERAQPSTTSDIEPWPLDWWPEVPTRYVLCTEDRLFPAAFMRRVVLDRLGVAPEEIGSGHCPALGHPHELADLLHLGLERARRHVARRAEITGTTTCTRARCAISTRSARARTRAGC